MESKGMDGLMEDTIRRKVHAVMKGKEEVAYLGMMFVLLIFYIFLSLKMILMQAGWLHREITDEHIPFICDLLSQCEGNLTKI